MDEQKINQTRKKLPKAVSAIIIALLFLLTFLGGYFFNYIIGGREARVTREIVGILKQVGYVVDEETGEFIELTESDFANAIVDEFLDIYSAYYTPEEYKLVLERNRGREQGLGFVFQVDLPIIEQVKGNSPAEKAGFIKGDRLVDGRSGDGEKVAFSSTTKAIEFMSGSADDKALTFTVLRDGEEIEISVKKSAYNTSYVTYYDSDAKYYFQSETPDGKLQGKLDESVKNPLLSSDIAYVVFHSFEGDSQSQMNDALDMMAKRGRSKLILDISSNGGGQLNILCGIASYLIENNGVGNFVVTYSKSKNGTDVYKSGRYQFKEHIKEIAVIASENSASASECLIGALTCYGGAFKPENLVIEKNKKGVAKTYGKGIMQTTYPLASGGAFKLTTARIYWPDGQTCIHGKGVIATGENAVDVGGGLQRAVQILSD